MDTISVEQAADSLQCAVSKVYRLIHTQQLPATKVNRYWVIQKQAFKDFLCTELLSQAQDLLNKAQYNPAIQTLTLLLHHFPKSTEALFEMGRAHLLSQNTNKALYYFKSALKTKYDDLGSHVALGHLYSELLDSENALLHFKQAAKIAPRTPSLLYNTALSYQALGDCVNAETYFQKALQNGYTPAKVQHARGHNFIEQKLYKMAAQTFEKALELEPENPNIAGSMAHVSSLLGDHQSAVRWYTKAVKSPKLKALYAQLAKAHEALQHFSEAIEAYQKHLKYFPYATDSYFQLGKLYLQTAQESRALQPLKKAQELAPKHLPIHLSLAKTQYHLEMHEASLKTYKTALEFCSDAQQQAQIRYGQALNYWALKDYQNAMVVSLKALNHAPESLEPHYILASAYQALGLYEKAIKSYQVLLKAQPKHPELQYGLGMAYFHHGDLDSAMRVFESGLKATPSADFNNALGLVYQEQNQYLKAFKYFQQALAHSPQNLYATYNMALTYMEQQQFDKALKWYKKTLALNPQHSEAHLNLGFTYDNLGNLPKAIASYQKALMTAPENMSLYFILGLAYSRSGDIEQAIDTYEKALDFAKEDPSELYYYMGLAYIQDPDYTEQAIWAFQLALEHSQENFFLDAAYHLGTLYLQKGLADPAIECFRQMIINDLGASKAYLSLAQAYQLKNNPKRSQKYCRMALKIAPLDPGVLYQVGVIYFRFHWWMEALDTFKKALDLAPEHAGSLNYMGSIYRKMDAPLKAIHYFKQALIQDSHYCQAYLNLSYLYFDQEDQRKALYYSQKAIECDSESADVYYWLGFLQYNGENWQECIKALNEALEIAPDHKKTLKLLPMAKKEWIRAKNTKKPRFKIAGLF